jgi:hypothetical protein
VAEESGQSIFSILPISLTVGGAKDKLAAVLIAVFLGAFRRVNRHELKITDRCRVS